MSFRSRRSDAYFPALRDHIISVTGLVYFANRPEALAAHIGARLDECGFDECREYLELLQCEPACGAELDQLVERLTIGETYFFCHRELFDALRRGVSGNYRPQSQFAMLADLERRLLDWRGSVFVGDFAAARFGAPRRGVEYLHPRHRYQSLFPGAGGRRRF